MTLISAPSPSLFNWLDSRSAGVLLHPTAIAGDQGVGTFDENAVRFLDFLQAAGMKYWQLCPLGPTGYGDSPYQCFSAFAGNPYLIDLNALVSRGLLTTAEVASLASRDSDRVDYGALYERKWPLLAKAFARFKKSGAPSLGEDGETFDAFRKSQASWLEAYVYFRALKDHHAGVAWWEWPAAVRTYAAAQKSPLRLQLAPAAEGHAFYQYLFFTQWRRLRAAASARGIAIIGDIPIFVAADSADVWAAPELFELDPATGRPIAVAGVPPDYFSEDGQLWGNPLYLWSRHAADDFAWWHARLQASFALYDVVRIDHFRGFDAYWRIPLPAATARKGTWIPGPGLAFFNSVSAAFPDAKIIAEDLGALTPSVVALREATGLPGMAILQFAFGGDADNLYLPHQLSPNSVIYPGTHDNDTSLGWYASTAEKERDHVRRYLRIDGREIPWDFIRTSYASVSRLAVLPMQDILSLGSAARFNSPGKPQGNWQWRYRGAQLDQLLSGGTAAYLRSLAELYGRTPKSPG
jgi:4-alpha-glucanotransferase